MLALVNDKPAKARKRKLITFSVKVVMPVAVTICCMLLPVTCRPGPNHSQAVIGPRQIYTSGLMASCFIKSNLPYRLSLMRSSKLS